MANGYIPRKDGKAVDWMKVFANGISENPSVYMLSPADAAAIQRAVDELAAAYALASSPETKTRVTNSQKDQARTSAEQIVQQYYALIKPNAGVSNADKIAIGVRPVNRGRTPITAPATSPALGVIAATQGVHTLCFKDSMEQTHKAKPFGAAFLELRADVGDGSKRDPEQARPAGFITRTPFTVSYTAADRGKQATYWGLWVSKKGETGPWSSPVGMTVAA